MTDQGKNFEQTALFNSIVILFIDLLLSLYVAQFVKAVLRQENISI